MTTEILACCVPARGQWCVRVQPLLLRGPEFYVNVRRRWWWPFWKQYGTVFEGQDVHGVVMPRPPKTAPAPLRPSYVPAPQRAYSAPAPAAAPQPQTRLADDDDGSTAAAAFLVGAALGAAASSGAAYEPGNCRWATRKEQARNTRSTKLFTHAGITASLPEICEAVGVDRAFVYRRLRRGRSIDAAISEARASG